MSTICSGARSVAILFALASLAAAPLVHAVEVQLPANAIEADRVGIWFVDLEKLDAEAFASTLEAVAAAAPEAQREAVRGKMEEARAEAAPFFDAIAELRDAGGRALVLVGEDSESDAEADTAVPAAADEPADAAANASAQAFLLAEPGSDPAAAVRKVAEAFLNMDPPDDDGEAPIDPASLELRPLDGGWWAVVGDDLAPPVTGDAPALDTEPYRNALQREADAAVRFAWVMTDDARAALQREMTSGAAAMFFMGVLGPLQQMDDATVGVWLGEQPRARVSGNFDSAVAAHQMKSGVDGLIVMASTALSLLPPEDPQKREEQERMQDVLALLFPDIDSATVTKTVDLDLLRRLSAAGVPWTGVEPEPRE